MSRTVSPWIGATDDTAIPPRVKIRVFNKANGRCALCNRLICGKLTTAYDHIQAIINSGANCESNIQLLCIECHREKTAGDVAEKSIVARKKAKHIGIRKPSRFPGSRDSGWKKKIDGSVVRR